MKKFFQIVVQCGLIITAEYFFLTPSYAVNNTDKHLAFFVGHSQWNKGSTGGLGLSAEWDYCRAIAQEVVRLAPQYHTQVKVFFRGNGSYGKAVQQMHQEKNKWDPTAPVISCHYNSTPTKVTDTQMNAPQLRALFAENRIPEKGSLMGTLVLYKPNVASRKLALQLLKNVEAIMPRKDSQFTLVSSVIPISDSDRGAKEILSPDPAPVMLLEIGYGDNATDNALMLAPDFQRKLAAAILTTFGNTPTFEHGS